MISNNCDTFACFSIKALQTPLNIYRSVIMSGLVRLAMFGF